MIQSNVSHDPVSCLLRCRYPYPLHWPRHATNFQCVSVQEDGEEWGRAARQLADTLPTATVVSVERCVCDTVCVGTRSIYAGGMFVCKCQTKWCGR